VRTKEALCSYEALSASQRSSSRSRYDRQITPRPVFGLVVGCRVTRWFLPLWACKQNDKSVTHVTSIYMLLSYFSAMIGV